VAIDSVELVATSFLRCLPGFAGLKVIVRWLPLLFPSALSCLLF
jgi:hypothetical protein